MVIRDLRLNTGQNFWKNHVTREDLHKVTRMFRLSMIVITTDTILLFKMVDNLTMYVVGWQIES